MAPLPYIPFANCAEVVLLGDLVGQASNLTFGVRKAAPFSGSDLTDIAVVFNTWLQDSLFPVLTASQNFNTVKVTDLTTEDGPVVEIPTNPDSSGGLAVAVAPGNVAMVVKFVTASRGRSFRGRNYVPGLPASDQDTPTTFGASARTTMAGIYGALGANLALAGFQHVVLSRYHNLVRRTTGVATAVTGYSVRAPIGTQRRRVQGVGI